MSDVFLMIIFYSYCKTKSCNSSCKYYNNSCSTDTYRVKKYYRIQEEFDWVS